MSEIEQQLNISIRSDDELSPAERFYRKHLERVKAYQKANPEKMREKCKKWNAKIKEEQPEKYQEILEQKRKYYREVRKPKIEAQKALQEQISSTV